MRLWHQNLIPRLCQQHIQGQHRECCALRGDGWNKNHGTVQYALDKSKSRLIAYHWFVMSIGEANYGIDFSKEWKEDNNQEANIIYQKAVSGITIYPEHDKEFFVNDIHDLDERSSDPDVGCNCEVAINE